MQIVVIRLGEAWAAEMTPLQRRSTLPPPPKPSLAPTSLLSPDCQGLVASPLGAATKTRQVDFKRAGGGAGTSMRSGASAGARRRARGSRSGADQTSGRGDPGQKLRIGCRRYRVLGAWTSRRVKGRRGRPGKSAKLGLAALRQGSGFLRHLRARSCPAAESCAQV